MICQSCAELLIFNDCSAVPVLVTEKIEKVAQLSRSVKSLS